MRWTLGVRSWGVEVDQLRQAVDTWRPRAWRGKMVVESWWWALGVGSRGLEVGQVRLEVDTWRSKA